MGFNFIIATLKSIQLMAEEIKLLSLFRYISFIWFLLSLFRIFMCIFSLRSAILDHSDANY